MLVNKLERERKRMATKDEKSIPKKLHSLYNDRYKLIIFTNKSNIERWMNKRQIAVDSKTGRLDSFMMLVEVLA
nr:polynucleotide 3'-phosphatase ZDP [Tanacetum cinerariifolium]